VVGIERGPADVVPGSGKADIRRGPVVSGIPEPTLDGPVRPAPVVRRDVAPGRVVHPGVAEVPGIAPVALGIRPPVTVHAGLPIRAPGGTHPLAAFAQIPRADNVPFELIRERVLDIVLDPAALVAVEGVPFVA